MCAMAPPIHLGVCSTLWLYIEYYYGCSKRPLNLDLCKRKEASVFIHTSSILYLELTIKLQCVFEYCLLAIILSEHHPHI